MAVRPVYREDPEGGRFVPRKLLPLSLSYDHRVIDGAKAARFTSDLRASLGSPRNLLV
jgi:pyruvate dehydrogenase E2 component (dihydrolipoamide acetyltransferase)